MKRTHYPIAPANDNDQASINFDAKILNMYEHKWFIATSMFNSTVVTLLLVLWLCLSLTFHGFYFYFDEEQKIISNAPGQWIIQF